VSLNWSEKEQAPGYQEIFEKLKKKKFISIYHNNVLNSFLHVDRVPNGEMKGVL